MEATAMIAEKLLLWLSAMREGSWWQFRAVVEELATDELVDCETSGVDLLSDGDFPLHQRLRLNLECLGHVEFFAHEFQDGWRVAPPTLAVRQVGNRAVGIMCGARSRQLLEKLRGATSTHCQFQQQAIVDGPDRLCVHSDNLMSLEHCAVDAGLHFQRDAPFAILMHLPRIGPPNKTTSEAYPVGADWIIHQFRPGELRWEKTERKAAEKVPNGFFRFKGPYTKPRYFLRWGGVIQEMSSRGVGVYVTLRQAHCNVLTYAEWKCELRLPSICRPPKLLERALVLCSGLTPIYDFTTGQLVYHDVPPNIARLAAKLLEQRL